MVSAGIPSAEAVGTCNLPCSPLLTFPIQTPLPQPLIAAVQSVPLQMQIESVLLSVPGWTVSPTTILYKEITNDYEFLTYSYID